MDKIEKKNRRRLAWFAGVAVVITVGGGWAGSTIPLPDDNPKMRASITKYVKSEAFLDNDAATDVMLKQDVISLFYDSSVNTTYIAGNRYHVVVKAANAKGEKKKTYLTFDVTVKPNADGKLNVKKINKHHFNQWFKMSHVKQGAAYESLISNESDSDIKADTDTKLPLLHNGAYSVIAQTWQVPDNEQATEFDNYYDTDSGDQPTIDSQLRQSSSVTDAVIEKITNGVTAALPDANLQDYPYFSVARISKNYYALLLDKTKNGHDGTILVVLRDENDADSDLGQLSVTTAVLFKGDNSEGSDI